MEQYDTECKYCPALHGVLRLYQVTVQMRPFNVLGECLRSKIIYLRVVKAEKPSKCAETGKEYKIPYLLADKRKCKQ